MQVLNFVDRLLPSWPCWRGSTRMDPHIAMKQVVLNMYAQKWTISIILSLIIHQRLYLWIVRLDDIVMCSVIAKSNREWIPARETWSYRWAHLLSLAPSGKHPRLKRHSTNEKSPNHRFIRLLSSTMHNSSSIKESLDNCIRSICYLSNRYCETCCNSRGIIEWNNFASQSISPWGWLTILGTSTSIIRMECS